MADASPVQPIPEVYAVFAGPIDQAGVQRIFNSLTTAIASRVGHVHLLFQSTGGGIGEGICVYNFFKALTVDLTLYNTGTVASIAVIAFLGAKRRKTSAHAAFMLHRTQTTVQFTNTEALKSLAESASLSDKRTEAILREYINMPRRKWSQLDHNDLHISAEEAVQFGIAHQIAEFSPPPLTPIYNV